MKYLSCIKTAYNNNNSNNNNNNNNNNNDNNNNDNNNNKNTDVLLISETKSDSFFPSVQFHLEDYATPSRLARNENGGNILLSIREDIPTKLPNSGLSIEGFFVEV